jgi:hypothetical protein
MAKEEDAPVVAEEAQAEANREEVAADHLAMEGGDVVVSRDGPKHPGEVLEGVADADACREDSLAVAEVEAEDPQELASNNLRLAENYCTHGQRLRQRPLDMRSPSQILVFSPFPNPSQHLQLSLRTRTVSRELRLFSTAHRMRRACDAISYT